MDEVITKMGNVFQECYVEPQSNIIEEHKMLMYLSDVSDMWDHGSDSITRYLLAQAYKKMGNTDDAKRELDVVSKMHSATQ